MEKFVLGEEIKNKEITCDIQSREELLAEAFELLCQLSDEQLKEVMAATLS